MAAVQQGGSKMRTMELVMPAHLGFHLRIIARFVQLALRFRSSIKIRKGKLVADGKSILGLLTLGAAWKSKMEIEVCGDDADQVVERINEFFLMQENR
ncbi:MAG TPA: HPr family phosphocarrier protein [Verrucomicrobiae bacterium]|nr:HPr family phosphocarrier protein [Verrucomicrobiae bacterium]